MITPSEALESTKPTDGFLCPLSANKCGIEFQNFVISNYDTKEVFFRIGSVGGAELTTDRFEIDTDHNAKDSMDVHRKIRYTLSEEVLRLPRIATSLTFKVNGKDPLPSFRMIERHYFRDELIKNYDFSFGFCIPGSTNTWDCCYSIPPLDDDLVDLIIDNPFETRSDSFYFVGDELVMHNKASYKYTRSDDGEVNNPIASHGVDEEDRDAKPILQDRDAKPILQDNEFHYDGYVGMIGESKFLDDEDHFPSSKSYDGGRDTWSKDRQYY